MIEFYLQLIEFLNQEKVKEIYRSLGVKPIKHLDLFNGQYLRPDMHEIFALPALFYEYTIAYDDQGKGIMNLVIHLCQEQLRDASSISRSKNKALDVLRVHTVTKAALKRFESPYTGKLKLTSEQTVLDEIYFVTQLSYECSAIDDAEALAKEAFAHFENVKLQGQLTKKIHEENPEVASEDESYYFD